MADATAAKRAPWYAIFAARPRLLGAALIGAVAGLGLAQFAHGLSATTDIVVGWDLACIAFMLSVSATMLGNSPDDIRQRAGREDEGRGLILGLVLVAAAASVAAIGAELGIAKADQGLAKLLLVALVVATVALSWLMVQVVFALHYAHEYYDENPHCDGHDMTGLLFPGEEPPDYWDFVHFAVVIGVAAQTADIAFTSKELRRIGTVHSLVAFAFNTIIVALTINLLAGLF